MVSRHEKRKALRNLIGNGLYLLVFGGGLLVFLGVAITNVAGGEASIVGLLIVSLVAALIWLPARRR